MRAALLNWPKLEETLREDYESFITEDGRFYISYSGACQVCAFRHDFKVDEQLDVDACQQAVKEGSGEWR